MSVESNVFTLVLLSVWSKKVRATLSTTSDGYEPKPIVTCSRAFSALYAKYLYFFRFMIGSFCVFLFCYW